MHTVPAPRHSHILTVVAVSLLVTACGATSSPSPAPASQGSTLAPTAASQPTAPSPTAAATQPSAPSQPTATSQPTPPSQTAAPSESANAACGTYSGPATTISFAMWGATTELANQQKIVDAFRALNPTITV